MNGAILADGANIAHVQTELGTLGRPLRFDIAKLEKAIRQRTLNDLVDFNFKLYYLNYRTNEDRLKLSGFVNVLHKNGWQSFLNPCKEYADGHYKDKRTDISIALDGMKIVMQGAIQVICLVTHDADFAPFFERVPSGIAKYVVGFRSKMANKLKAAAEPIYIDDFWREIERRGP